MKKFILILAVLLAGCEYRGKDIVCGPRGELYTTDSVRFENATPLYNRAQICLNQPDGTILIKSKTQIENDD